MHRLAASAAVIIVFLTVANCQRQLPCNSQLRLNPAFAHLFTHCQCTYSEWSEWAAISSAPVSTSQCPSGRVVTEERRKRAPTSSCTDIVEDRNVCEPELVDQLIIALGLGSTGQHISPNGAPGVIGPGPILGSPNIIPGGRPGIPGGSPGIPGGPFPITAPILKSGCGGTQKICQHVTTPHGKRSIREERKAPHINIRRSTVEAERLPINPTRFNMTEHGSRYRRQSTCSASSTQHLLFVLDTSGSVGEAEFNRVTSVLSELVLFFCKPIRIAVMTFDHEYFIEFCFNCFDNSCNGRVDARDAIRTIDYNFNRNGVRYTHTGGAARCVCDFMLSSSCGVPPTADCIDVVFITDGRSNDPSRDVCQEVRCLHNRYGVNTYALGIRNAHQPELECITDDDINPDQFHLFNFPTFDAFEAIFMEIVEVLLMGTINPHGDPYVCIDPQSGPGTQGCIV